MRPRYLGLTWDHPRGRNALVAAASHALATQGLEIVWTTQPLEGFESRPIQEIGEQYDLVVLDHPHLGEAVARGALLPLDRLLSPEAQQEIADDSIGACFESYRYDGRLWALPLDAASQVMALRADLLDEPAPTTWDAVEALAARSRSVVLSLAGPHALLSLFSIAVALDASGAPAEEDALFPPETLSAAFEQMARLFGHMPRHALALNPIALLQAMATRADIVLCPLVYGYVNYAEPGAGRRALRFVDAPRCAAGGRPGSTLGGTGIALCSRCAVSEALLTHLLWLTSAPVQTGLIPAHDGQPSRRSAWFDPALNARWGGFYRGTAATLEQAFVRPRHAGYVAFQVAASEYLRAALAEARSGARVAQELGEMYRRSRRAAGKRQEPAHA
jgi:multiple sugar transport system substrate-binding protein